MGSFPAISLSSLLSASESYIIAGPKYTFQEAFEIAERITGVKAPRIHPAPGILKALAGFVKLIEAVIPLPEMYSAESLRVTAGVTYLGSNAKAKRELGYHVRPLEEGLRETLEYEMKLLGMKPQKKI